MLHQHKQYCIVVFMFASHRNRLFCIYTRSTDTTQTHTPNIKWNRNDSLHLVRRHSPRLSAFALSLKSFGRSVTARATTIHSQRRRYYAFRSWFSTLPSSLPCTIATTTTFSLIFISFVLCLDFCLWNYKHTHLACADRFLLIAGIRSCKCMPRWHRVPNQRATRNGNLLGNRLKRLQWKWMFVLGVLAVRW